MAAKKKAKKVAVRKAPTNKSAARKIGGDARVDGVGAVRIKALTTREISEAKPNRRHYWCGTKPNCPIQNLTMGGINFDLFRGKPVFDSRGNPDRPLDYGHDHNLTDEQVERVINSAQNHVIRVFPKDERGRTRGRLINIDKSEYRPNHEMDFPIAAFIYMVESDFAGHAMRQSCDAPVMLDEVIEGLPQDSVVGDASSFNPDGNDEPDMVGVEITDAGPSPVGATG